MAQPLPHKPPSKPPLLLPSAAVSASYARAGTTAEWAHCTRCLLQQNLTHRRNCASLCYWKCNLCDKHNHRGYPCPLMQSYPDVFTDEWIQSHMPEYYSVLNLRAPQPRGAQQQSRNRSGSPTHHGNHGNAFRQRDYRQDNNGSRGGYNDGRNFNGGSQNSREPQTYYRGDPQTYRGSQNHNGGFNPQQPHYPSLQPQQPDYSPLQPQQPRYPPQQPRYPPQHPPQYPPQQPQYPPPPQQQQNAYSYGQGSSQHGYDQHLQPQPRPMAPPPVFNNGGPRQCGGPRNANQYPPNINQGGGRQAEYRIGDGWQHGYQQQPAPQQQYRGSSQPAQPREQPRGRSMYRRPEHPLPENPARALLQARMKAKSYRKSEKPGQQDAASKQEQSAQTGQNDAAGDIPMADVSAQLKSKDERIAELQNIVEALNSNIKADSAAKEQRIQALMAQVALINDAAQAQQQPQQQQQASTQPQNQQQQQPHQQQQAQAPQTDGGSSQVHSGLQSSDPATTGAYDMPLRGAAAHFTPAASSDSVPNPAQNDSDVEDETPIREDQDGDAASQGPAGFLAGSGVG